MPLLVIGNAVVDRFFKVERLPREGESIFADAGPSEPGGKGLNQAVMAARTGAEVVFCSMLGRDTEGLRLKRHLAAEGLDGPWLGDFPGETDQSLVLVGGAGENAILTTRAAAEALSVETAKAAVEAMAPGDLVLLQGNLGAEVTIAALRLAKALGLRGLLNPSPVRPALRAALPLVELLIVNAVEAETFASAAVPMQVTTLGAKGAMLRTAEGEQLVSAAAVRAVDTTGAGDVLAGVLAGRLALGDAIEDALALAVMAATLKVARAGTASGLPTATELASLRP